MKNILHRWSGPIFGCHLFGSAKGAGRGDFSEARLNVSGFLGGECWTQKRMGSCWLIIRHASRDAAKCLALLSATTPSCSCSLILVFFPLLPPFSSPSFILPKWAPTKLDTAQLMATVVAGRAYLAATSHAMKI
jgi:hypothetical protein